MPRGLKVSHLLLANMIPFVNISNFFKWKNVYFMTFRVAHWDTWDDSSSVLVCKGKIILGVLMASVMCLYFSMQVEDILEHSNGKGHYKILVNL